LLAAVTLMLTLPSPKRLLLGYLLGAAVTSITCGLLLVFLLPGSSTASIAKHTINPIIDLTLGVLVLLIVARVARGRDRRRRAWREHRREKARDKPPAALEARTRQRLSPRHVHRRHAAELPRRLLHRRDGRVEQTAPSRPSRR
jgi:Sap, sulfolipid-1-addressing protein